MCCETSLNNFFVMLVMHHFFTLFHHVLVWWSSFSIWLWRLWWLWRFGCFWTFRFLLSDELFHFSNGLIICIGVGLSRIFRLLVSKRTLNCHRGEIADPFLDLVETLVTVIDFAKGTGGQKKWQKLHFGKFLSLVWIQSILIDGHSLLSINFPNPTQTLNIEHFLTIFRIKTRWQYLFDYG